MITTGNAILKDGTRMDYKEYIEKHPYWKAVRKKRFEFDEKRCVVCHKELEGERFETHHLTYIHLGHEHLTDVITLCPKHHAIFHENWSKNEFWKGRSTGHWEAFSLEDTAKMCVAYYNEDLFICKDINAPNLCNTDTAKDYIDRYCRDFQITAPAPIDPYDLQLFVRNKRCELLFEAIDRGLTVEEFLTECYGEKVRGKNPIRIKANKYFTSRSVESFRLHYSENPNLNKLMELAKEKEKKS